MTWLVSYVAMLLVVCHLSRDVIGYEDLWWSNAVHKTNFIEICGVDLISFFMLSYLLKSYCMIVYNPTFFELNANRIIGCL